MTVMCTKHTPAIPLLISNKSHLIFFALVREKRQMVGDVHERPVNKTKNEREGMEPLPYNIFKQYIDNGKKIC